MMMINRFRKSNYVLLLLTKVLTKHMLITGQSHNVDVEKDEEIALSVGIHGVPFYVFDGKYSVPGALAYNDFKNVLTQIINENDVNSNTDVDNCKDGVCKL